VLALAFEHRSRAVSHSAAAPPGRLLLTEKDGALVILSPSIGEDGAPDPGTLWLTARPYDDLKANDRPLDATIGEPVAIPQKTFSMSVVIHGPPGAPGLYDVTLHATRPNAATIERHSVIWWPDKKDGDASLRSAQQRFAGRLLYGYGGTVASCPRTEMTYSATPFVRVRAVERERDRFESLGTGSMTRWHDPSADVFLAFEPLRFLIGRAGPCPEIALADWQLETTVTTNTPPRFAQLAGNYPQLRYGMTRNEVMWRLGYPPSYAGRASVNHVNVWDYAGGAYGAFSVTFENDRVASFSTPEPMP
jgi:hypothetical protein